MSSVVKPRLQRWREAAALPFICVALAAIATLIGAQIASNATARRDAAAARFEELKTTYQQKYRKAHTLDARKAQMIELEQTFGPVLRKIGLRGDQVEGFDRIQQVASAHRLVLLSYMPAAEPHRERDFYAVNAFELELAGRYQDLAEFYLALTNEMKLVGVDSISVTRRGNGVLAKMRIGYYSFLEPEPDA